MLSPVPGPTTSAVALARGLGRARAPRGAPVPVHRVVDQVEQVGPVALLGGRPPPGAGGVATVGREAAGELEASASRAGSSTRATRPNISGSHRRSHASLVMVKRRTGTLPHACGPRHRPPSSSTSASASTADSVSFQSFAGRSTAPVGVEHDQAVLLAGDRDRAHAGAGRRRQPPTHAASNALHQVDGSCSLRGGVVAGCGRATGRDELAGVGVADLDLARRGRRVDAGDERHQRTPRSSSVTSWSSRSWP